VSKTTMIVLSLVSVVALAFSAAAEMKHRASIRMMDRWELPVNGVAPTLPPPIDIRQ
jgi:hypothetical protein